LGGASVPRKDDAGQEGSIRFQSTGGSPPNQETSSAGTSFSTLKIELAYRNSWRTRDKAENAIFGYIDGWYNTQRIQKELGRLSPDEYEAAWHTHQPEPSITPASPTGAR
jgi:putative transposase